MNLLSSFTVFIAIGFVAILQLSEVHVATATVIPYEQDDGKCHCLTEVTLNIPPCTCSGMVETVHENIKLRERVKELQKKLFNVNNLINIM